jgi:hypothetical protein
MSEFTCIDFIKIQAYKKYPVSLIKFNNQLFNNKIKAKLYKLIWAILVNSSQILCELCSKFKFLYTRFYIYKSLNKREEFLISHYIAI